MSDQNFLSIKPRAGFFIDFEGIDGTGKGTLVSKLKSKIDCEITPNILLAKEPGWDEVRHILFEGKVRTHGMAPNVVDCLFLADHIQMVEKTLRPALDEGKIVICDRYAYSQYAYSSIRPVNPVLSQLYKDSTTIEPDVIFLLIGTPEHLLVRANKRTTETHQEGKVWNDAVKQARIQDAYLRQLSLLPQTVFVPTDVLSPDEILETYIWPKVKDRLKPYQLGSALPFIPDQNGSFSPGPMA